MEHAPTPPDGTAPPFSRFGSRSPILTRGILVAIAGLGIVGGLSHSTRIAPVVDERPAALQPVAEVPQTVPPLDYEAINTLRGALLASLAPTPDVPAEAAPVEAGPAVPDVATAEPTTPFAQQDPIASAEPGAAVSDRLVQTVPLPMPRPRELSGPNPLQYSSRSRASRRVAAVTPQAPQEDTRSFFDKLFGVTPAPQGPALAYAALEQPPSGSAIPRQVAPAPAPPSGGGVAVYDISARTVTLPNGEKLEAHSGLGEHMDNPSSVAIKMRGATPPGVYDLTEREQLFHGVRAIRLNPVGGAASIYGRAGLLAHTFMLGPSGASNGCISFRDYNRFLQAYLSGQVARVVVVPGNGQDVLPSIASRATVRTARAE